MKIAYIITGLGLGGAEAITIDIANCVSRAGNKVLLLYLTGENSYKHRIDSQIEVIGFDMRKTLLGVIKAFLKARAIMNAFHPDIIHAQMFHACIFSRFLLITSYQPKLICTEHTKNIGSKFRMKLYQYTNALSDFNTNVSEEAVNYFIKQKAFKRLNSKAIYNGIDLSRFIPNSATRQTVRKQYNISESDFLFINVGRLTEAKDQHSLIDAFSAISDAKLMIVGQGNLLHDLEQFTKDKGMNDTVIFAGAHKNIEDFYCAADCFVLSSAWEGLPLVLVEAMACLLPVIATNVSGSTEIMANDYFIVPSKDSAKLAAKMKQLQSMSPTERQVIGTENRQKAKRFDIENIVAEWMGLYSSVLEKKT